MLRRYIKYILKNTKSLLFVFMVVIVITGCSKKPVIDDDTEDLNDTTSVFLDWNHPALDQMRVRADIIGKIKWTPKGEVPKRDGVFPPGVEVTGVPYSSVKELDKFIGQEVSFYTFLSAVNNPRSVLYIENVGLPPYYGSNCAAYYGSVCSMTVNYALGLDRPYSTSRYKTLPFIKRVAVQDLEHAAPGDIVFVSPSHVFLITNITKNENDDIQYVYILECAGSGSYTTRYSKQQFQNRLDNCEYVMYRYMDLYKLATEPSPFPAMEANVDASMTNNALSLDRGDRVTYSKDENKVIINVLEEGYDKLEVFKIVEEEEIKIEERVYNGTPDIELTDLAAGSYKAVLEKNGEMVSDAIWFEILQTEVSFSKQGNNIDIHFYSENAIPEYVVFCGRNGARHLLEDITDAERQAGHKLITYKESLEFLYLKVFFRGEYGRVSNVIIPFE